MCGIQNLLILKVLKSTTTADHVTLYLNQGDGCNMQTMGMWKLQVNIYARQEVDKTS